MEDFITYINNIYPISIGSANLLMNSFEAKDYKKGSIIIQEGIHNNKVYFVANGLTRSYAIRDGKEITTWFSFPGEPLVMTMGAIAPKQTLENVEALEDCTILIITREKLEKLFCTSLEICNWGRRLADGYLCELETFITDELTSSAKERYIRLLEKHPDLINKVPLKYLASYLLITPESLSRIRAQIKNIS